MGVANRETVIEELGREIVWPVSLATLSGTTMMVRETTDHDTPLADGSLFGRLSAAVAVQRRGTGVPRAVPRAQRDTLIDILARSGKEEDSLARAQRADLQRMLAEMGPKVMR